jgi:hypothetical protein
VNARARFFQAVGSDGQRVWVDLRDGKVAANGTYEGSPAIGVCEFLKTLERDQLLAVTHDLINGQWNAFVYYLEKE